MYQINQLVGIVRYGSRRSITGGLYTVVKSNKVRIHVRRPDGFERIFSAKTGRELSNFNDKATLVSIDEYNKILNQNVLFEMQSSIWQQIRCHADRKDLKSLKESIQALEDLVS